MRKVQPFFVELLTKEKSIILGGKAIQKLGLLDMRSTILIAIFALFSGVFTGLPHTGPVNEGIPDAVTILQSNPLHQNIPSLDETLKDAKTVSGLYSDLNQLPKVQNDGPHSCPLDFGVTYQLTFTNHGRSVGTANVDASGCRTITFNGQGKEGESLPGEQFFSDFSLAADIPLAELGGYSGIADFEPLDINPVRILIDTNGVTKTITDKNTIQTLVVKFNQAGKTKPEDIHCMSMTKDVYVITFVYSNGQNRIFENRGGSCQPMTDMQNGFKFPAGDILSDTNFR